MNITLWTAVVTAVLSSLITIKAINKKKKEDRIDMEIINHYEEDIIYERNKHITIIK